MSDKTAQHPDFPKLEWKRNESGHGQIRLPAWAGLRSRQGAYGARDRSQPAGEVVRIDVNSPDSKLDAAQVAAIEFLLANDRAVFDAVIGALYARYPEYRRSAREDVVPGMDLPEIASPEGLGQVLGLTGVHVLPVALDGVAYVGFELGCDWEEEHGLGVMVHRTRIIDIGHADLSFHESTAIKDRDARSPAGATNAAASIGAPLPPATPATTSQRQTVAEAASALDDPQLSGRTVLAIMLLVVVAVGIVGALMLSGPSFPEASKLRDAFFRALQTDPAVVPASFNRASINEATFTVDQRRFRVKAVGHRIDATQTETPGRVALRIAINEGDETDAIVKGKVVNGEWQIVARDDGPPVQKLWHLAVPPPAPKPQAQITTGNPRALIITSRGNIEVELFEDDAPNTVANFVTLVEQGFYDGLRVHRIVPGFMAQTGCPTTRTRLQPGVAGTGGPGYRFANEITPARKFSHPGVLAMANSGPDTNGSQFFITFAPAPMLDDETGQHYNIFGRVVAGMETTMRELETKVKLIRSVGSIDPQPSFPAEDVLIKEIRMLAKRAHPYTVEKLP